MKKYIVSCLALLLVIVMAMSAVACGNLSSGGDTTKPDAATVDPSGSTEDPDAGKYDEEGYLKSSLPDELDYNEQTITVLYWRDVEMPEFESEKIDGDAVNDAIFKRNANIEKDLNIKLAFESTVGNGGNREKFVSYVGNAFAGGESVYDLIAAYSRTTANCAIEGYCADMTDLDYLDYSMPWWPDSLLDIVPIGGRIYFASGDASINVLHFMYSVYYNKDMITEFSLENPVELVRNNGWTLEKLQQMSSNIYLDLDNDKAKSVGDRYGFGTVNYGLDAFYTGSGLRLVEPGDADMLLKISDSFYSEKAADLCTNLSDWFKTEDAYIASNYENAFVSGNMLFIQDRCYLADRKLQDVTFKYGILPTPKYDTDQEEYISVVGNPFTLYAIYSNTKDQNTSAAVLECWASEAYRTTTPAQFEINMKLKYSDTSDEADMYNIIRSTICFDLGRLFNTQLSNITDLYFAAAAGGQSWATLTPVYKNILSRQIKSLSADFAKQQAG